ncbi:hypothetical protein YDYSY3_58090 [Paenibacillus chitinolyticus]|uniref:hypothetical protein n=1 Tax=Paenibacillus chitinolyticus TaxID=79263 RepID=UPI0026E4C750|nr:hypothetical protein [Paenibacillus chitinolyticus]GKS14809.1 hypothetical protein YDYSY3_58090 [Paenibacillus chitinolyticus]
MNILAFFKKNSFVLGLLLIFVVAEALVMWWNPLETSRRFGKDDFTKTLYHHGWSRSGAVFYGNSSVTGAYIEEKSAAKLVEMGLSYGKLTDLEQILQRGLYTVKDELVIGIDVHTLLDKMETDYRFPWNKPWYKPYVYAYRADFLDAGKELVRNLAFQGSLAYEPRWIDKELYHGYATEEAMTKSWARYEKDYNWMTLKDMQDNLDALQWILGYSREQGIPLRVVWMPFRQDHVKPPYVEAMKQEVNARLKAADVPVLDLMDYFAPKYFHDLVHLNREEGAPLFTKEVDEWLLSLRKPSKS